MLRSMEWWIVIDVSKDYSTFETSETIYQYTRRNVTEDLNFKNGAVLRKIISIFSDISEIWFRI
jgi:hypothetical protein